jgi:hypothetical protein
MSMTRREITIVPRRLFGRVWLVKLAEVGHGGNKWVPYIGTDPTRFFTRRLPGVLQRSARRGKW